MVKIIPSQVPRPEGRDYYTMQEALALIGCTYRTYALRLQAQPETVPPSEQTKPHAERRFPVWLMLDWLAERERVRAMLGDRKLRFFNHAEIKRQTWLNVAAGVQAAGEHAVRA